MPSWWFSARLRPEYSQDGATRAILIRMPLIDGETAGIPLEQMVFCFVALRADPQRLTDIQREHLHKVFAVYLVLMVGNHDREGTSGCDADEILHILRGSQLNSELHKTYPRNCTKSLFSYIMGVRDRICDISDLNFLYMCHIISIAFYVFN